MSSVPVHAGARKLSAAMDESLRVHRLREYERRYLLHRARINTSKRHRFWQQRSTTHPRFSDVHAWSFVCNGRYELRVVLFLQRSQRAPFLRRVTL